jgi:RHS repeat-associated protein
MTDQLGNTETYGYDLNDNLTSVTDRKGQATTYQYDLMDRLTRADYTDSSYTTYIYDEVGRLTTINDSVSGQISYTYTTAGCSTGCSQGFEDKVEQETTPLGAINYEYDAIGRRTSMTVGGQPAVTYGYDANSHLTGITRGSLSFGLTYDAARRRTGLTYPNEVTIGYAYDGASRLLNLEHRNSSNAILESLSYTYDANGNRTSMNRLNVLPKLPNLTQATYDQANRMLNFGGATISYDNNGNMTLVTNNCGVTNYTWDARDRLAGINGFDDSCQPLNVSFQYDALGRRIEKTINGRTIQYLYDGLDIVQEKESGAVTVNYLRMLDIDEPLARIQSGGAIRYYHANALGSVIALTDENAVIRTQYNYTPSGVTGVIGEVPENPFQFTGRENDGTGLYYYRARYYDPLAGRFISEDPVRFAGGDVNWFVYADSVGKPLMETSAYLYAGNNPVNKIDPFGLYWEYAQSTGQLTYVDNQTGARTPIGLGYSGKGPGLNNPAMQNIQDVGPIPQGTYDIGQAYPHHHLGRVTMNLYPRSETNTFGRDLFRIHGDDACRCHSASGGCIVLPLNIRNQISDSSDRELRVVQ